ncbi:hypothetical protein GGX14DRAFT_592705 [Mycena pura]|uniref:F-box domain-containing protein n=1 Tax=Mycena pura TaxID=153505 RepID=A0AAD6VQ78_9AGAR|nr:hypothetical protein GGX14DRAFT_592705 [Mycena pura]
MASSPPRLPNELCDTIIQDLHSEPKSLSNCALVCHAWTPTAQRSLFSKLSIHERNCRQIVERLTSTTIPHIAAHVKHLYVHLWGDLRSNINRSTADRTPILDLLLSHISQFTNVEELTLDGCRAFTNLNWDVTWTDLLAGALPSISRLTVSYLDFEDLPHLVDLVTAFPQLTQLNVDDIDIVAASHEYTNEDQEPYDGPKIPPPLLKTFAYSSGNFASGGGPFLRWLAAGPQTFSTLHLELDAEAGDVNAGVELVGAAGDNLETLFLTFDDQWQMWEGLEFSENSSLRSLTLGYLSASLVDVLQSVKSPLKHLTLRNIDELDEGLWPRLIETLMGPSFALLARVNFCVAFASAEDLRNNVAKDYPEFFKKGIAFFASNRDS